MDFMVLLNNSLWMGWNVGLAFVPFLLSWILFAKKRQINTLWILGFLLFVVFLPNAPYIFTDVIHLYPATGKISSDTTILLVIFQYIILLSLGFILFSKSFEEFENFASKQWHVHIRAIRLVSFFVISCGVYLGRFLRLNSWDFFLHPFRFVESLAALFTPQGVVFVTTFIVFLYALYGGYRHLKLSLKTT